MDKKYVYAYALKNAVEHEGKAVVGAVISGLFNVGLDRGDVKKVMPDVQKVLKEINSWDIEKQKKEFEKYQGIVGHRPEREGLPELPDVPKTGVIMRFSPSSSASAFHIGHILTGMPTSLYVKKYGGKFYLRIEDTNPEKTVSECYESFPKEAEWIFGNVTEWYAQSDRMKKYYEFAEELIKKSLAFVCTCKKQEDEEDSETKLPRKICDCRNNSIKGNREKWKKMLDKKGYKEGEAVLRFKSPNTNLPNPALIDFPLARINEHKHPRQGNKYRVWPLMNLAVTVDDIEQKCTHIIRGKEHRDNALRQEMILDALKIKKPRTYFVGRYKFTDLEISKTKITERIKKGEFSGWDDIRLPLARNFRRRGYQPAAFAEMAVKRGLSEVDKVISQKDYFSELNNFNREIIKDIAKKIEFKDKKEKGFDKISIRMPDNIVKTIYADISKVKEGDIVYFQKFGYARLDDKKKKEFWFGHN